MVLQLTKITYSVCYYKKLKDQITTWKTEIKDVDVTKKFN